jgi:hypothetical protein
MPFDPANVRLPPFRDVTVPNRPKVTVLPPSLVPTEPGEDGDPRRQVHIEVVVHVPAPPRRRRSSLWWWLAALLLIALAAHAQPHGPGLPFEWTATPFGDGTLYHGTDSHGGQSSGSSSPLGDHVLYHFVGPNEQHVHCESSPLGDAITTRCRPDRQ